MVTEPVIQQQKVLDAIARGDAIVCLTKCWDCSLDQWHQVPPKWHTWADNEDIEHAKNTGQPDPSTSRCGCPCADVNATQPDWGPQWGEDGPDLDDHGDVESYTQEPCPVCDATGACGWDTEGRPLLHAVPAEDDR